jgi:hypothetical protein
MDPLRASGCDKEHVVRKSTTQSSNSFIVASRLIPPQDQMTKELKSVGGLNRRQDALYVIGNSTGIEPSCANGDVQVAQLFTKQTILANDRCIKLQNRAHKDMTMSLCSSLSI